MAALDTVYRRQDIVLSPATGSSTSVRRNTVGSPDPFNAFHSRRPASRDGRFDFAQPYRNRRSTVSGHQGHNVNDAPPLTAHGDANMMWSGSASSSPIMGHTLLPRTSSTPSSSCDSPKPSHGVFESYDPSFSHSLQSPIHSSFSLCPSPDFPDHLSQPRMLPPLLSSGFTSTAPGSIARPSMSGHSVTTTTPALSPAASSTSFTLDPTVDPSNPSSPRHLSDPSSSTLPREDFDELTRLRHRVRDLEFINDLVRLRVAELESDNKSRVQSELGLGLQLDPDSASSSTTATVTGSPAFAFMSQELGPSPPDWQRRTSARLKRFCALNRAGNALCAWHDSRRERRAYPPRMAPQNTLNCGCTYSQALFEESLARNGVGAFYPGESVRMDPALRNPLLKLLEQRYGYQDGDFERTSNGRWRDGEDARSWEQMASRGCGQRPPTKRERS